MLSQVLVQRCWRASSVLEDWERLNHLSLLQVSCKRCSSSTMSQSIKTLPKSLVSSSQSADLSVGCPSRIVSLGQQTSCSWAGWAIAEVPCEMCLGTGSRQKNLAEVEAPNSKFLPLFYFFLHSVCLVVSACLSLQTFS